ncbi:MAG: hypothetical protein E6713_12290 [Sporomusaceae bacterium]|nr:hypothetical protein [Sporomusaceae bacterium]
MIVTLVKVKAVGGKMKVFNRFGDQRLKSYAEYNRAETCHCIYCGEVATTREHVPSKVFLDKPYPENLPVLPACFDCNNGYSVDETYVASFIEKLARLVMSDYVPRDKVDTILNHDKKLATALDGNINIIDNDQISYRLQSDAFDKVLQKLAKGHAVYEMDEVFYEFDDMQSNYKFCVELTQEELDLFNEPAILECFPEVGSRMLNRVIEGYDNNNRLRTGWVIVQEGRYRYMTYLYNNSIVVRIVINEFLYAEVHWGQ